MSEQSTVSELGVAEAKSRFSELLDRVARGERFVVSRRGRPVVALVPPEEADDRPRPKGLAAGAGALADVAGFAEIMRDVYASRRKAKDRPAPDLG
jgi:prevent-host-death family protein